jgi:hypothetical protein
MFPYISLYKLYCTGCQVENRLQVKPTQVAIAVDQTSDNDKKNSEKLVGQVDIYWRWS